LLDKVKVARDESLAFNKETVASAIGCLVVLSTSFPLMLPSAFWACAVMNKVNRRRDKVKIFFIIS